jgi:TP53 regulating kinase-like protein
MEYVDGAQIKLILNAVDKEQRDELCFKIGEMVAKLHRHGIVHGDLTTSNMILASDKRIFLLDFGLGDKSFELEAQGVDLHLLKRALQSTHFEVAHECFNAVLKGYASVLGEEAECKMLEKLREIEKRGRYVAERQADSGGKRAEL